MSTIDPVRRPDLEALIRALIEEAWQRARRRRRVYAGVVFSITAVGVFLLATGPSTSEGGSPGVVAGASTPAVRVAADQHVYHGRFRLDGKRGSFGVAVAFPSSGKRSWDVVGGDLPFASARRFGQYARLAGGHGQRVEAGGHKSAWYARLVGFVIPNEGPKQRVVIKLKGRPEGTFVLIPAQPGVLKRDSGTQSSGWMG
jgi:hypothetical protein